MIAFENQSLYNVNTYKYFAVCLKENRNCWEENG